ncbi:MAG: cupredoxin domain-containing protein [Limosilactobacillus sp.]|nr:cupredoxin domain-containing protein [Limosilactobacillus sp.]MCI1974444.1 cupredoxin domain-containing protein [Limosilactobacillus sp.]MCI2031418.1 cupredoxin domain-containing protein [Limosilactobacillus sp.]
MIMVKIIALIVAIALIVGIIWWFFGKHTESSAKAQVNNQQQTANIVVHGGYSPERVVLKKGVPATVNFEMKDGTACLSHVVFDKLGVDKDLTKQKVTSINIPTDKAGEYNFACGMDMFHGKVVVK